MTGPIRDFVKDMKGRGMTDEFVIEVILETGETANKPGVRYMQTVAEDWILNSVYTREESRARKERKEEQAKQQQQQRNKSSPPAVTTQEYVVDDNDPITQRMRQAEALRHGSAAI
ncbi:hypothetical protein D3C87_1498100 [compost metagenome]